MPRKYFKPYNSKNQYIINFSCIFFSLFLVSCSTDVEKIIVECEKLIVEDNTYYFQDKRFTGKCQVFEIDIVLQELFFEKGKKYKEKGYFFPSGNIKYEGYIKNDSLSGKYFQYHDNGQVRLKGKFWKGFPDGRWRTYDNQGLKLSVQIFDKGKLMNTIINKQ